MRHVGDPEPGPRYEKGVRFYEGEPDAPEGQWVRVLPFQEDESRQAFFNQVAAKVEEWNHAKPGHRMPEMVTRTISPWTPDSGRGGDSGLTVIALPEGEGPDEDGQVWFDHFDIRVDMTGRRDDTRLYVNGEPRTPSAVHQHAVALLAAAIVAGGGT
ncbi:hypothetical protein SEA_DUMPSTERDUDE_59 [Gordonia phage DumpsterDude]|uniref:Uncharacterized protein n=1 Tax=Gordonia phage DumpsterDude TaxID=2713262 RepID=A0A6G8R0D6_9CAUD|nr:hypothetical protein JZX77_gp59 [Gordonia phage DumpsterDude]QIN93647.1 hypothetical protein SEA_DUMPSTERDUDE_59 [Gordonia phage DumpsterDude]